MRNLRNIRFGHCRRPDLTAACWDPERDDVVCTAGPTPQSPSIELLRITGDHDISLRSVATWDAPSPNPDLPVDRVLSIQYLSGSATTCLVLEGGDIITVQEDEFSGDGAHIEIVGSIDDGIAAARWSPDEELLAVVTKTNSLIFMGASFDPVAEVSMTAEDLKASKHVSVGWGKRETQFQGRGAKALRDPTIPEKVDQGLPSPHEDNAVTISWRGDGAYVAINAVEAGARRIIRVYSREGELDSASEPVDGLEGSLSWRPSGNLMAGIQRFSDRVDVVFFERNGLRHGQFTLRSPTVPVTSHERIRLEWNSDSTILAVIYKDMIQLWTTGNYHWYLKQEIPTDSDSSCLAWHPEKALRFAAPSSTGVLITEHIFYTARGSCLPPFDNGAVAVVDGESVKLTPFRTANVPPPMSLFEITAASAVVDVAFGYQNTTIAVLHRNGVDVYEWPLKNGRATKPQLLRSTPFKTEGAPIYRVPLRITYTSNAKFSCFTYQDQDSDQPFVSFEKTDDENMTVITASHEPLRATTTYQDESTLEGYGQDNSGKLYRIGQLDKEILPIQFHTQLPWFEITKVEGEIVAFGLSRNGHIYANSRQLAKNCTSFIVTPTHLVFTTNNHLVKFVHLSTDVEELEIPADDPEKDERCRSVERGSRLVTAIPTSMSLVFQMPRGNLETIFPRAMVLAGIRDLIDEKNYARAFSYCRTQRVDMNILYDHQPDQFLANVGLFLDQISDVTYVDLFLSSLRPEDVTENMYQDTKRSKIQLPATTATSDLPPAPRSSAAKVNAICDALLSGLQSRKDTNLQNIITAHVCKSPPALDDGLNLVADLMREDEKLAEKAVEHICFLVDVNRLYENALGLYNLELALLVAQQSQRDPREYLPFMQNLHKLTELRRKFEIDDHLARREKALGHLQTLDAFDELVAYTTQHSLYHDALRLYRYDQPRLHILTGAYAEHLEATSAYREAGLAYESLQNYAKATSCYRAAGAMCWQECLFTAQQQDPPLSADSMTELATALADALWEAKDYASAAIIHLETLKAIDMAIRCLCKGYHFAEAIRTVVQRSRPDLLTAAVDPGLAEALGSTTEFLADCKSQLNAQVPRIAELRRKAAEDPLAFYEGERGGGLDIPDDVSVASSRVSTSASLFTRYTGKAGSVGTAGTGVSRATSKNRRREEKKRARGRKGTVYEEEYLVNSVRRLVERVNATTPDVERLVFALVRRGMPERARAAEALMADVSETCARIVADVFDKSAEENKADEQQPDAEATWKATGGDAVLQEFVLGQSKRLEPPPVTNMKKLTLLGS
ncbi:IKI3 family-domain-containing protein [Dactylonectria estremocensis]|uniref:Elongator complex protein 1 n=1 Tax=Dactylonectria estremocensis TaxID=1079267 RepID=A0A9P9J4N0_9HYPO|nr:IKI3 family-domain-containing protein [Dactylonectria estremocensis]